MSFNQNNNKLYISANLNLFELGKAGQNAPFTGWDVSKETNISKDVGDLAFGPFGKCYCNNNDTDILTSISTNSLATIDFGDAFGEFTNVSGITDDFKNTVGADFVLTLGEANLATLYTIESNGDMYEIDTNDASKIFIDNVTTTDGDIVVGASSCQAGEDNNIPVFPFYPGASPWIFMLDGSGSMDKAISDTDSTTKFEVLKLGLSSFIENNIRANDVMTIVIFSESWSISPTFIFKTTGDIIEAVEWIDNLATPNGPTNFCTAGPNNTGGPFNTAWFESQGFNNVKNIVVIGDGDFGDCTELLLPSDFSSYVKSVYDEFIIKNPDAVIRSVGIYPGAGVENLKTLGTVGGGGYSTWQ